MQIGPQGIKRACPHCCRRPMARLPQSPFDRAHDHRPHRAAVTEADLAFGGMHIHIHKRRRQLEIKHTGGMTTGRQQIRISPFDRAKDQPITHGPTIHIKIKARGIGPMGCCQSGKACEANILIMRLKRHRILHEGLAKNLRHTLLSRGFRIRTF